jgi:hypothetical protein
MMMMMRAEARAPIESRVLLLLLLLYLMYCHRMMIYCLVSVAQEHHFSPFFTLANAIIAI